MVKFSDVDTLLEQVTYTVTVPNVFCSYSDVARCSKSLVDKTCDKECDTLGCGFSGLHCDDSSPKLVSLIFNLVRLSIYVGFGDTVVTLHMCFSCMCTASRWTLWTLLDCGLIKQWTDKRFILLDL